MESESRYRDPAFLETFLLERVRETTELDKLDFKLDWKMAEQREKLELLKDINALANTFSLDHDDHGFPDLRDEPHGRSGHPTG